MSVTQAEAAKKKTWVTSNHPRWYTKTDRSGPYSFHKWLKAQKASWKAERCVYSAQKIFGCICPRDWLAKSITRFTQERIRHFHIFPLSYKAKDHNCFFSFNFCECEYSLLLLTVVIAVICWMDFLRPYQKIDTTWSLLPWELSKLYWNDVVEGCQAFSQWMPPNTRPLLTVLKLRLMKTSADHFRGSGQGLW